jgi:hypothetical protein
MVVVAQDGRGMELEMDANAPRGMNLESRLLNPPPTWPQPVNNCDFPISPLALSQNQSFAFQTLAPIH